jgi:hypothetical protein
MLVGQRQTSDIQFREYLVLLTGLLPPHKLRRTYKAFCRKCNSVCHTSNELEIISRLSICNVCNESIKKS